MKNNKNKVLIIEDDEGMQYTLKTILKKNYSIEVAANGQIGIEKVKKENISIVLLDLRLPDMDGLEILTKIKAFDNQIPVVIVSASIDIKSAVECMKLSAFDYVTKPFEVEELLAVVKKANNLSNLLRENRYLKETLKETEKYSDLIGNSPQIIELRKLIKSVAKTPSTILITGESGTGKEIVAKEIRRHSDRSNRPFVAINCAAIPENLLESELFGYERGAFTGALERRIGKFELANNGTLFLDEIGCMHKAMQSKLLRVFEDRQITRLGGSDPIDINVRIIAATNIDFEEELLTGSFREDLYYRLNVIPINLSPLRDRKDDIPLFINYFIEKYNRVLNKKVDAISKEATKRLLDYFFPGNVRELQNLIERAVVLCQGDTITIEHLWGIGNGIRTEKIGFLEDACKEYEKKYIQHALHKTRGNKTQAAKILGVARSTLKARIDALTIEL
ncbi:sigma-54-dependent transcriptional regulator [Candidatus Margulisiibacteriota bacterium]